MEEKKKNIFLIQNSVFGALMGVSFIITSATYLIGGQNVSTNPQLNNIIMLLTIAGAYIGTRKYRDEKMQGIMSYAQALGNSIFLISAASVLYGIFILIIYSLIPGLLDNYVETLEATFREVYANSQILDPILEVFRKITTPLTIALAEILNKIIMGCIFSLLLAGMLRKTSI